MELRVMVVDGTGHCNRYCNVQRPRGTPGVLPENRVSVLTRQEAS
jgi:hypothetical protein